MIKGKSGAVEVLERLMSSYSVNTQKNLAEELGIAANNISGWLQRNSVPGDAIVKCALDTGADLHWLVSGEFANASFSVAHPKVQGKALLDKILESGGKAVLRRILDAYGFKTQKELGDLLDLSSATISTWIRRNYFPGDVVVACALDTGVSLEWLATGKGNPKGGEVSREFTDSAISIKKYSISSGNLVDLGLWFCDKTFVQNASSDLGLIEKESESWLVDFESRSLANGRWLIDIDGVHDIYNVTRIPGNKIQINNKDSEFQCNVTDVECKGQVKKTILIN